METPKQFFLRQSAAPRSALAGTPLAGAGQGLSDALGNLARSLPEGGPVLPAGPAGGPPRPRGAPRLANASNLFRSIEANLPDGAPSIASLVEQKGPGGGVGQRGTVEEAPVVVTGVATRGML